MPKIIAVSNQKGGVGKTTTTGAVASGLKNKGFKVLAVDLDPQSNLSFSMGANTEGITIYNVLKGECSPYAAIQHTDVTDIIASNILLSGIELEYTESGREYLLRDALKPFNNYYDYIIVDTPPTLGVLTVNAYTASRHIIVPMLADIFSLQGITQIVETVNYVTKYCNPEVSILGILLTKFNPRTRLGSEIKGTAEMITSDLGLPLFNTTIRSSVAISEAQTLQQSILNYAPRNKAISDYAAFIEELVELGI
ncbi:MAG: ParA family protein [Eubacteriales bacterium]|jgi:chromosome partitioning protein